VANSVPEDWDTARSPFSFPGWIRLHVYRSQERLGLGSRGGMIPCWRSSITCRTWRRLSVITSRPVFLRVQLAQVAHVGQVAPTRPTRPTRPARPTRSTRPTRFTGPCHWGHRAAQMTGRALPTSSFHVVVAVGSPPPVILIKTHRYIRPHSHVVCSFTGHVDHERERNQPKFRVSRRATHTDTPTLHLLRARR